uniref:NADH-ubiquinone oxidoreductase chain 5 n=1 Tax=Rana amurensis TaxID=109177 RepID=A0A165EKX6_RANAM|nr:NADH dehydrogenase subunit 5 [Rana amurensis]AMY15640.1 NADH dehydrogenase subunit 5 [Rana amurensis]
MSQLALLPLPLTVFLIIHALSYAQTTHFRVLALEAVKIAFFLSLFSLYSFLTNNGDMFAAASWLHSEPACFPITMQLDLYTALFLPIAFLVSWSILEFSSWYMQSNPNINLFFKYLLILLLAMIVLVCSGNFSLFFIGWEGMGIMSFLLIGWYHARTDAATAAFQAVLYNRKGDIGLLLSFCWIFMNSQSNFAHILSLAPAPWILTGLMMAVTSKSAQFGSNPWLTSAMEGPTPVSALLHSSTMVVASIFLLIRIHPLLTATPLLLSSCLCLGALSTFSAATNALMQNDIKKIIAYSTSSQLGLMMVAIGLNLPYLAFFHMCTHVFFKATLFLCSGLIIHALNNEQDIRNMGGLQRALPTTTACLSIGSFALMGTPFLAGFYSKDAIIEAASTSHVNFAALLLTLVATAFTSIYSMRLIYFASMANPRMNPTLVCDENDKRVLNSLSRLAYGSILAGIFIFQTTMSSHPHTLTMPTYIKLTALIVTILAFIYAYELTKTFWTITPESSTSKELDPSFFTPLVNRPITTVALNSVKQILDQVLESYIKKKLGPSPHNYESTPTDLVHVAPKGQIKMYLSTFFITLFFAIVILKIIL